MNPNQPIWSFENLKQNSFAGGFAISCIARADALLSQGSFEQADPLIKEALNCLAHLQQVADDQRALKDPEPSPAE